MKGIKGFRVEKEQWIKFKAICILSHTSPEKELASFIDKYIKKSNLLSKPSLITRLRRMF